MSALAATLGYQLSGAHPARIAPRPAGWLSRWQHHLPWMISVAALLLIVLGLDIYWSRGPAGTTTIAPPQYSRARPANDAAPPVAPKIEYPEPTVPEPMPEPPPVDLLPAPAPAPRDSIAPPEVASDPTRPQAEIPAPLAELFQSFGAFTGNLANGPRNWRSKDAAPGEASDGFAASSGRTAEAAPATAAAPPAARADVLTVGDAAAPGSYSSLQAACSAAKSGDTIELRYSGRRTERPFAIANVNLTVRAAAGFEPIVVFAPESDKPFAPLAMVSVAGGQLSLSNLHFELDLPRDIPAQRALFEAQHCDLLELERCTLTIRGQPLYPVAFFDIKAPPGYKSMGMNGGAVESRTVNITLQNCVARGEATLVRDSDLQSVRFEWENGLLVTSERVLVADGGSVQPQREPRAEVFLQHVTASVGSGLVLLTNSREEPYQLATDLRCDDCLITTTGAAPLVEQRGSATVDEFMALFQWRGDNDYFDGFDVFWQIMSSAGQTGAREFNFAQWQARWQFDSRSQFAGPDTVQWNALPEKTCAAHSQRPSDFALDGRQSDNAPLASASGGADAGALIPYLPALPTERVEFPRSVGPFRTP